MEEDEKKITLDYRPTALPQRGLPQGQSRAGMAGLCFASLLVGWTLLFLLRLVESGLRPGDEMRIAIWLPPIASGFTVLFGGLGLMEDGPAGRRDGTAARWSLWIMGMCWIVAIAGYFIARAIRGH